ncbi:hypothetical protein E2C01_073822 [Portunus trituberculatus]|uniref:Uncharacterized protein n=1 Tax=Portunus trituberculatus TaxID=210409 RepID=A0A5B7I1R7_PORTR|nr:hypothetical protein [Portunus trituberculatus]
MPHLKKLHGDREVKENALRGRRGRRQGERHHQPAFNCLLLTKVLLKIQMVEELYHDMAENYSNFWTNWKERGYKIRNLCHVNLLLCIACLKKAPTKTQEIQKKAEFKRRQ